MSLKRTSFWASFCPTASIFLNFKPKQFEAAVFSELLQESRNLRDKALQKFYIFYCFAVLRTLKFGEHFGCLEHLEVVQTQIYVFSLQWRMPFI